MLIKKENCFTTGIINAMILAGIFWAVVVAIYFIFWG